MIKQQSREHFALGLCYVVTIYTAMQNSYVIGRLCPFIVRISRLKCTVRTGHIILLIGKTYYNLHIMIIFDIIINYKTLSYA